MPSSDPGQPSRRTADPGLAIERTALAWRRTSLGLAANAALLLRLGLEADEPVLACAVGVVVAAAAAATWTYGRRSAAYNRRAFHGPHPVSRPEALRAVALATVITAIAGTALGLLFALEA